jgi:hypothetical protein
MLRCSWRRRCRGELLDLPHNHAGQRRTRRKAWLNIVVDLARMRGDRRPRQAIVEEHIARSEIIRKAFADAHRDKERAETVALQNYPDAGIFRAEVLTQARSYVHPRLLPP